MFDQFDETNEDRIEKRSDLAHTLATNGYADCFVSTREKVSGFGVKEWTLISLLDNQSDPISVPKHSWSAAYNLADANFVKLDKSNDTLTAQKKHNGGVVVRIF